MQQGQVSASNWNSRNVEYRQCGKVLKASSLGRHLADIHDIYQQAVVAEELLEDRPPVLYTVRAELHDRALLCPYPGCNGLWECLTAVCKALSLANAKGKGTDGLVIRS